VVSGASAPAAVSGMLPELANVHWRPRVDDRSLSHAGRLWTLSTTVHTVPFVAAALVLGAANPILLPFAILSLVHAWAIPELYAARGVAALRTPRAARAVRSEQAERVALGLLGDLVDHRARELHAGTGLVLERGRLGVWLLGRAGALLVRPGGRRVNCYCVRVPDASLPPGDRTAHLLLARRSDEIGFATLANLTFSGARWRVRRRLAPAHRTALDVAVAECRAASLAPGPMCSKGGGPIISA
jgi:hypothetical protein